MVLSSHVMSLQCNKLNQLTIFDNSILQQQKHQNPNATSTQQRNAPLTTNRDVTSHRPTTTSIRSSFVVRRRSNQPNSQQSAIWLAVKWIWSPRAVGCRLSTVGVDCELWAVGGRRVKVTVLSAGWLPAGGSWFHSVIFACHHRTNDVERMFPQSITS